MKTKYLLLGIVVVLAAGGLWFGRMEWRVRHQLVSLDVRKATLAEVLKKIERQTHQKIRAERGLDTRITLRMTDKPLAYVLDRLAEQTGARWSTIYAVYDSPKALHALETALSSDGKLETAGWTKLAPSPPDFKEPGEFGATPQNGPGLQVQPLPQNFAPGARVTATEDSVVKGPGPNGALGQSGAPKMVRVFRKGGADGNGPTEQEFWTPEELVMESGLNGRLGGAHPEDATAEIAAETARKINGHWTTYLAFRKSHLGMGYGGISLQLGRAPGPRGPIGLRPNAGGTNFPPGAPPGPLPGDLQDAATRERNDQFAHLTPEQRVQRARARQGVDENGNPQ